MNEQLVESYPLAWPAGVARTAEHDRKRADFGRQVQRYRTERGQDGYERQVPSWKSREKLTVSQAIDRLQKEIDAFTGYGREWRVNPQHVVISSNLRVRRTDGLPASGQAEPHDPGVAVYFPLDGDRRCIPCDKWDRVADNIAGVAAAIGAIRGLERWVNDANVRAAFRGFLALPDPNYVDWRATLGFKRDEVVSHEELKLRYRRKAHDLHPDRGGDEDAMAQLNRARDLAEKELGY